MNTFRVALGMGGGAGIVALLLALPVALQPAAAHDSPPAKTPLSTDTLFSNAAEIFTPPYDPSGLLKWKYTVEPGVSTEVRRQSTVKKIGYGRTEFVNIVETASGTYSTDGLTSPNVEYPGIHKQLRTTGRGLSLWIDGRWVRTNVRSAGSFVTIVPFDGGRLVLQQR